MIIKESGLTILCCSVGHECDWGECEQGIYGVNGVWGCVCGWCMARLVGVEDHRFFGWMDGWLVGWYEWWLVLSNRVQ